MDRKQQLAERDVKKEAPDTNPNDFLSRYLKSNFPQTAAIASQEQKDVVLPVTPDGNELKFNKKPLSGTAYDKPGAV